MKKHIFSLFLLCIFVCGLKAAVLPNISTDENTYWYYIQFVSGGAYVTDQGEGLQCLTSGYSIENDAQLWKIEESSGSYIFTNKLGRKLYVDKAQKSDGSNGFFYASSTASSNTEFSLIEADNSDYWLIAPKTLTSVYMNQYGGAGEGVKLGLWTGKSDTGSAVNFVEYKATDPNTIHIIPYPKEITQEEGLLLLNTLTSISYASDEEMTLVTNFATQLKNTSGISLNVKKSSKEREEGAISLIYDSSLADEAYTILCDAKGICITAASYSGFFYGIQSLKQLLPTAFFGKNLRSDIEWEISYLKISDEPQLQHRGFMLDIARHFFDKDEVKRVLDMMALYKLNRFHWHLTDDQGWRIEIPNWPKLTEIGAVRAGSFTNAGGSSNFYDDTTYGEGCYYTVTGLKEIVEYAKERNIEIIPEIDLPGHMVAAVASYPELGCHPNTPSEVRINGGISEDVLNIGKDETIDFLKDVLKTVAEIFPYQYIHIGGDECPTDQWATNEDCLKRVSDEGLSGVNQLQSWLVEQLGTWLKDTYNKDIVVWDELLSNWNDENTVKPIIMAWNNNGQPCVTAANKGLKSIMVPYSTLYFDFMQVPTDQRRTDELYQGGWGDNYVNTVPEIYSYNPLSLLSNQPEYILGVQGNMWTETCCNNTQLEYQMLPRLLALSETAWLPTDKKNTADFFSRLQSHAAIFDSLNYVYAKHYFIEPQKTEADSILSVADNLLSQTKPDEVGYVSLDIYNNLKNATETLRTNTENEESIINLQNAIDTYKNAEIIQPEEGRLYRIRSASTYYKAIYDGSTIYENEGNARFHYTPQTEPEEIWQFVKNDDGFVINNYTTGNTINMPTYNANLTVTSTGKIAVRIDKPSVTVPEYDYIPGVVMISMLNGYTNKTTGSIKRFFADCTGYVKAYNNPQLCYPGTWRIEEITDFTLWLQSLVDKCNKIVKTTDTSDFGQPTQEALDFLSTNLINPATEELAVGNITESVYKEYVEIYNQYLAMPKNSVIDQIDPSYYYTIQNVYFSSLYAKAVSLSVKHVAWSEDDAFYWKIVKDSAQGTIKLINKSTGTAARVSSFTDAKQVTLSNIENATSWQLGWNSTAEATGITIGNGTYSWYTNSSAGIILRPIDWGGSMWNFNKTSQVVTEINNVTEEKEPTSYYDLMGRKVNRPTKNGIYISDKGKKILIK